MLEGIYGWKREAIDMLFKNEDRIKYERLAPSLQNIINSKAEITSIQKSKIELINDLTGSAFIPYNSSAAIACHGVRADLLYKVPTHSGKGNIYQNNQSLVTYQIDGSLVVRQNTLCIMDCEVIVLAIYKPPCNISGTIQVVLGPVITSITGSITVR